MHILRRDRSPTRGDDDFQVRRIRPGTIGGPGGGDAFGPLAVFDHAKLARGKVVRMHEHRNDEILSYMWRGTMVHEDSAGQRVPLSPSRLMMMNAGKGFRHEESVPDEPVEMLQVFVRPREADLPSGVAFHDRLGGMPSGAWGLVAGPEGTGAPLTFRNEVHVYDVRLSEGQRVEIPSFPALTPLLYVVDGSVEIGGVRLLGGDAITAGALPSLEAASEASLVLFLVDTMAPGSKSGTISGRQD